MTESERQKPSWTRFAFWAFVSLCTFGWALLATQAMAAKRLEVSKAEWKTDRSELKVEGKGEIGKKITVTDAYSSAVIGTATVDSESKWKIKVSKPSTVPCRALAEGYGQTVETGIKNAPDNCGGQSSKTLTELIVQGPTSVAENSSATYTATASLNDGSSQQLSSGVTWSENSPFADIGATGALSTSEVNGDQIGLITASYTYQGVSKTATLSFTIQDSTGPPVTGSHAGRFDTFEGTKTCLTCHAEEAKQVHGSVHYQWKGDSSATLGLGPENAGKLGAINDFCIYPDINWIGKLTNVNGQSVDGGCAKCHAGLGEKPDPGATQSQLENIDCLICHSAGYKRKVDMDTVSGKYQFVPDTANMGMNILQAAADITLPSKDACLNCHTKSGGGDNFKRGDIEEAHRNATKSFDVHMASTANGGAGLECLDCHTSVMHRIAGRGTDLRPKDSAEELSCTKCHSSKPHGSSKIDKHTARVNCTVCHIPTYAKVAPTDMVRDWSQAGDLVQSSGLFEPHMTKQNNVVPEYRFFNGLSHFYRFGDPAVAGDSGKILMSGPDGSIQDPTAKIHAFKHHLGRQPIDPGTNALLPLKIGKFFESGDLATAVQLGVTGVGWPYQGYEFADTERYMGLFHEVAPKENALSCNSCHSGGTRLDFGALGYTPSSTYNGKPLCASCHGDKSSKWSGSEYFTKVHEKHVADKKYDCGKCHAFSAAN